MFQCYSLKSSHPRLLPQSPKVCSLHPCPLCCLTYRVIITIFLNSMYMHCMVAYQAPPSMGFSRQECWNGLPFPSSGDFPNSRIKPSSPALQIDALPSEPSGKPSKLLRVTKKLKISVFPVNPKIHITFYFLL